MDVNFASVEFVRSLEEQFPVDEWMCESVHIWPLLRVHLGFEFVSLHSEVNSQRIPQNRIKRLLALAKDVGRCLPRPSNYASAAQCDTAFLADGQAYQVTGGTLFERIFDPIRFHVHKRGFTSNCLVMTPPASATLYLPARSIYFMLERTRFSARSCIFDGFHQKEAFFDAVSRGLPGRGARDLEIALSRSAGILIALIAQFTTWLGAAKPSVCFVQNYYSLECMAFIAAARRLGIPTIDIQHGVQGDGHLAYAKWARVAAVGYDCLPMWFWTWTVREAKTIRQWSDQTNGMHRTVCGGHPFLQFWKMGLVPGTDRWAQQLDSERRRHGGHAEILFALSGLETSEELDRLIGAIRATNGRYMWWLRAHPTRLHQIAEIENRLESGAAANAAIASEAPLLSILSRVTVHVTGISSTALEAEAFGVPTVFVSSEGSKLFSGQLAPEFIHSSDYASLPNTIDRLVETAQKLTISSDAPHIGSALDATGVAGRCKSRSH